MAKSIQKKSSKTLSILLSVMMIITSVSVCFSAFAADPELPSTANTTLTDGTFYTVTGEKTISGGAIAIAGGATVGIRIPAGAKLTVTGGAASGTTAGKAAIKMNAGSKLVIIGEGELVVKGGKGGNGTNGSNNNSTTGGSGGAGGAGGGAGIGTDGGGSASAGAAWPTGASVTIADTIALTANPGGNGNNGSNGTQSNSSSAGGAGGGGGKGAGGAAFGTGGGGGKAGSGGTNGSSGCTNTKGTNGSVGAQGDSATAYTPVSSDALTVLANAVSAASGLFAMTRDEQIAQGHEVIAPVYQTVVDAKDAAETVFSRTVVAHFFPDLNDDLAALEISVLITRYTAIIADLAARMSVDITALSMQELTQLYEDADTQYTAYKNIGIEDVYNYFEVENGIVDREAVEARLLEIQNQYEIAYLRDVVKPEILADCEVFNTYDQDWVIATDNAGALLNTALTKLNGYKSVLANDYLETNVKLIFGDDIFDNFDEFIERIGKLIFDNGYKTAFADHVGVYRTAFEPVSLDASENDLYSVLNARDAWVTQLEAFIAELEAYDAGFAAKVEGDLYAQMQEKIGQVYSALNAKVEAKINTAYELYMGFVQQYGYTINTSDDVCVSNYTALQQVFNQLDPAHYNFLKATPHFTVSEEAVARYEEIKNALFAFKNYDATKGLSAYDYNKVTVADILRQVEDADVVRDKDFTVDSAERQIVYDNVKTLLGSDLVKGLLGDSFDLSSLGDTVRDFIFSDSLVNTLISLVYPIVIDNFAPVWATQLPETYQITQSGATFNFTIKPNLDPLRDALSKLNLYALPNQLAAQSVMNDYPEIKAKLAAVTYDPVYDAEQEKVTVNPWNDPSLVDEDGKLALEWGVHDKESFINALNAGLAGVAPIILALLSNVTTSKQVDIRKNTIKASGKAYGIITVNVTLENIWLNMSFTGNPGFNNALAPILSALGAENISDGNNKDLRGLATCIADGFEDVINKLSADPLDFILNALPNLAFALNNGLVAPLLNELKETIKYSASAYYTTDCSAAAPDTVTAVDETSLVINLGEMLDLEEMGIDLTSASGLINSIIGLLGGDEEAEPGEPVDPGDPAEPGEPTEPGEGEGEEESSVDIAAILSLLDIEDLFNKLAYAGESVTWKAGFRSVSPFAVDDHESDFPYIVSAPADLFMFVLRYLLDSFGADEALLPNLINAITGKEYSELPEIAQTIISNVIASQGKAIAALTEMMDPVEYEDPFRAYAWKESGLTYGVPALEASDVAYLKYANNWTKEKAEQLVEGSGTLVETLMASFGQEGTLGDMLRGLIGGVFNNETVASLKGTLAGLSDTLGDAAALLNDVLGVDLGAFAAIDIPAFEDGDVTGFFNAVKALLAPLSPVVAILFGEDFSALDGVVNVKGYDTYPAAVKQLFDAFGIGQIAEGTAPDAVLGAIIDAVGAKIDELLTGNVVKNILGLLPNVVYFLESEGLGTAVFNLLVPVQIVLDVIRPIYDVDLTGLITGLLPEGVELDLETLTLTGIVSMVDGMLGTRLAGTPLTTYAIPALYADKTGEKVGDFTSSVSEADTLTILLSGAIEAFEAEASGGRTNGEIIIAKIAGDDAEKQAEYVAMYKSVLGLLTADSGEVDYEAINWDYMYGGDEIDLAEFALPAETDPDVVNYLLYTNNWNEDVASYLDENFDAIVNEIVAAVNDGGSDLGAILQGLFNDKLYTDEVANAVINLIGGLLENVEGSLLQVADLLLDTDLQNASFAPVSGIDGKEAFINALCGSLAPIDRLLSFALFGDGYRFLYHEDGADLLAVNGGEVYDMALVPVLEALGVAVPAKSSFLKRNGAYDGAGALRAILEAVAARLDEVAADPVNEILALIPNVIYFINADGLKAAVRNALAPFDSIIRLVTGNEDGALFDDLYGVPVDDLTTANILTLIENATADENGNGGIRFSDTQKQGISMFYIGQAEKIESVNGLPAFRMVYRTGDGATDRRDMITIVLSLLLDVLKVEDNIDLLNKLSVDGLRDTVFNVLYNLKASQVHPIEWYNTEAADTETSYSPVETSTLFPSGYGPYFTEKMAQYLADNFECFVDDMIQLLGIELDGEFVGSLQELLEHYIGTSLFTTENLAKIADALKGYVGQIDSLPAAPHIKEVIKRSLGVDIDAFMDYVPGEVNDKEAFINELNNMFTPFAPLLRWLLCDEKISFFYDANGVEQVTMLGAEGYRYGVIPILEALFCEDIPDYEAFKALGDDELIPAILDPVLTKLDFILEHPAERLLEILPNVAYFINSKGLDVCVKNITDPVQMLLDALAPTIGAVSVEKMIANKLGVDSLNDIDVQMLLDVLLVKIEEGTDVKFDSLVFDAVAELTAGKVESFTSLNGETAYRMVYSGEESKGDMVTSLLRIVLKWAASDENSGKLKQLVRENFQLSEYGYRYVDTQIDLIFWYCNTELGMNQMLHAIFYTFFGIHAGTHGMNFALKTYNEKFQFLYGLLSKSGQDSLMAVANVLDYLFTHYVDENGTTGNVFSEDGLAPNGILPLFRQLLEWFRSFIAKIKLLFSGYANQVC